jgi:hypothetical protein
MGKLVILKFGHGSFEQGFPVTLEIREETNSKNHLILERSAKLPPNNLPKYYEDWRSIYRQSEARYRLNAPEIQATNYSIVECQQAADKLLDQFNDWLCCQSFLVLRDNLVRKISETEEVRVVIQTQDSYLEKLPWHLWEFLVTNYPEAEVSLRNLP